MNSGSLDEIIYKILFQGTNIDNVQQLFRENSTKKQLLSIPSTKVKVRKQRSQIQTERTLQNDKQLTIDKYIFKSEINRHQQIQTTSDQMFYFSNDKSEESSEQQVSKLIEKTCQSQLQPNTKRNLKEQFESIEYITPQKIAMKEQVDLYERNNSQKTSSDLIKVIDIETNQITSFDTFMKTDQSLFNLLENPVKDEKLQSLEQKSQKKAFAQQDIYKTRSHAAFLDSSVKLNLQSQFDKEGQINTLQNANYDQKKLDQWLQKLIHKKQTNQIYLSQQNKQKGSYQQIQIKDQSQNLNKLQKLEEVQSKTQNDLPNKIIQIKSNSTLEQVQKNDQNKKQEQAIMKQEKNVQILKNDLTYQEKGKSKEKKLQEETQNLSQDKPKYQNQVNKLQKEKQNFDVKKEIVVLLSQILKKKSVKKVNNDPILENLQISINNDIAKLLQESKNRKKGCQYTQSKIQSQEVDLNNQNLGTFEFIDQIYNIGKVIDNKVVLMQQLNQNEIKLIENIGQEAQQLDQNVEEKKTILVDNTFDIYFHQI
ncbi:hypothetical protein ABPG72_022142 [Tetrahymena utriculariae]